MKVILEYDNKFEQDGLFYCPICGEDIFEPAKDEKIICVECSTIIKYTENEM